MAAAFAKSASTIPITPQISRTLPSGQTTDAGILTPIKTTNEQKTRPNTGNFTTTQQVQLPLIQKLTFPRLPAIIGRLSRETHSSSGKRWRFYRSDNYVDFRNYSWRNLPLYTDYKDHLWTGEGAVRTTYMK